MAAKKPTETVVVDIDIPFWRWVSIMVKLLFAAIPAAILFSILFMLIQFAMAAFFGGIMVLGAGGAS